MTTSFLNRILTSPTINRVRRNHALEHATIHILSGRIKGLSMVGRSTANCFYLYGNVTLDDVQGAVTEALDRLRAGERELAIHPGCGTNLVASSGLAGLGTLAVFNIMPRRRGLGLDRLPLIMSAIMLGVLVGQPLGMRLQELVTTNGDPGDLHVVGITQTSSGRMISYRVDTISN